MSQAGRDPGLTGRQPGAVHGALSVLEEVARVGPGVTAQQISAALGLPRATTYRLLNLLVQDEYLVRLPDLAGFALGRKVALLAGLAVQATPEGVHDILLEVRRRVRGGVHLASYREGVLELVDVDPDFPLSDERRLLSDLTSSALGRLLLAERRGAPVPYVAVPNGPMPGHGCFAAAIRDPHGALVAGLALALPTQRLGDPEALLELTAADRPRLATALC
ncbi:helix-turn-helix domain-containing protein [Gryllotalpicola koreensis]|uniref:HTH iclR-type domain-containing protein n=1 Tax=Gryllotalpicola koreensis TaxID=993086 RepID=A0ABP8A2B2_9MICO